MLGRADRWLGKAVFVPPIIRFCQRTGMTQFAVHNYLYLVGAYLLLAAGLKKEPDAAGLAFLMALVFTIKVGRNPGYAGAESPFLRRFFLVLEPIHATAHLTGTSLLIAGPNFDLSCPVGLLWLTAEYARTIKTIPPLESQKPASQRLIEVRAK